MDGLVDGLVASLLTFTFADGSSGGYLAAPPQSVSLATQDHEIAALIVTETGGSTRVSESRTADTITVRPSAQPVGRVVIRITSLDQTEFTVSPLTIQFDGSNWNVLQTLTIVGVDDSLIDGTQLSTLQLRVDVGSQGEFLGLSRDLTITTTDDELSKPAVLTPASLTSSQRPVISWTSVAGAVSYQVIIDNRTTGVTGVINKAVATRRFQSVTAMGVGAFAVRVRAISSTGRMSLWNPEYRFRIDTAPTLVAMQLRVNSPKPTFRWNGLTGAVFYDLQVDSVLDIRPQIIRRTKLTEPRLVAPANLPLGLYEVKVRAIDATGVASKWSTLVSFYVVTAPVPLTPLITTFQKRPMFSWQRVSGAVEYDLKYQQIATGQMTEVNAVWGTTFRPAADLVNGTYRWWVRARGMYDVVGDWSAVQAFSVGGAPQLLPMGSTTSGTPRIEWTKVEGAVRYFLRVDRIDLPTSYVVRQEFLTSTSYVVSAPLKPGVYRVWVKAISGSGQVTSWSRTVALTVAVISTGQEPFDSESSFILQRLQGTELMASGPNSKNSWIDGKMNEQNDGGPRTVQAAFTENNLSEPVLISASHDVPARVQSSVAFRSSGYAYVAWRLSRSEQLRDVVALDGLHPRVISGVDESDSVTEQAFAATDWLSLL